mgnify:CR=1 FL=1
METLYGQFALEVVVAEVDGSVVKSNDSASDLSAMTEENKEQLNKLAETLGF